MADEQKANGLEMTSGQAEPQPESQAQPQPAPEPEPKAVPQQEAGESKPNPELQAEPKEPEPTKEPEPAKEPEAKEPEPPRKEKTKEPEPEPEPKETESKVPEPQKSESEPDHPKPTEGKEKEKEAAASSEPQQPQQAEASQGSGPQKIGFVVNPAAQNGRAGRKWPKIAKKIEKVFPGKVVVKKTEKANHAAELIAKLIDEEKCDCVVGFGGDGTISECISGYLKANGKAKGVSFAVFPFGTGGDFRKTLLQTSNRTRHHLKVIKEFVTVSLDAGKITSTSLDGGQMERHFINIASCGISGEIVDSVQKSSKALGGMTYLLHTAYHNLIHFKPAEVTYSLDGGEKKDMKLYLVAIGNGKYFGGGMKVVPDANPSDGVFHIATFDNVSKVQALKLKKHIKTGTHIETYENINSVQGKKIYLEPKTPGAKVMIEADGEAGGILPATFEILAASIKMVVPKAFVELHGKP